MQYIYATTLWLLVACIMAAPVDDPIKIDLPVYDQPASGSGVNTHAFKPEHKGEDRMDPSLVAGLISHKLHAATAAFDHRLAVNHVKSGIFGAPVTALEGALLEHEDFGSKKLSIKENLQHIVSGIFQPKPIVDTLHEEEKYGNHGDKFYAAGKAIVGGAEGVSNIVNTVLEVPGNIFKKITRLATEKLNNLGGKLIGL